MRQITNLKEKRLLIAHYFCENDKKEFTPNELLDMWSKWFKDDFKVNGKAVFCVENDELVYRKSVKYNNENIRKFLDQRFQEIYKWIEKSLSCKEHNKIFYKEELRKLRNKHYGRVIGLAKPLGIYLTMNTSNNRLAEFRLVEFNRRSHTITSGDCDKMIKYLQNMKEENGKCMEE